MADPDPGRATCVRRRKDELSDDLDRQRAQIMRAVRQAGTDWAEAMRAHKLAPPDAGSRRGSCAAEAAGREQVAWEHAHAAGLMWRPIPGAENAEPPYELRPRHRTPRPGGAVGALRRERGGLNRAITGSNAAEVADAFGELSEAAARSPRLSRARRRVAGRAPPHRRLARAICLRASTETARCEDVVPQARRGGRLRLLRGMQSQ